MRVSHVKSGKGVGGKERSDAPGRASADPRGLEDSSRPHKQHVFTSVFTFRIVSLWIIRQVSLL